jgi:branched-chain amino acid transport system ATP-binding protein
MATETKHPGAGAYCFSRATSEAPIIFCERSSRLADALDEEGLSIMLVEQNASLAIQLVDCVHVIEKGKVVYSATPQDLWGNDKIKSSYLGI